MKSGHSDHLSASSTEGEHLLCKPEAKIDPGWRVEAFQIILTETKPQSTERARVRGLLKKQKGAALNLG